MKWLITGGCGFIGKNLISKLIQSNDHKIRIIDNLSVGTKQDLKSATDFTMVKGSKPDWNFDQKCQLVVGDIMDEQLAIELCKDVDIIVHLAANTGVGPSVENPRTDCLTNIIGTLNYLEAARFNGVKRFIFASSGAPAGEVEPPIHEELPPHPVSPYGASKLAGEGYCSAYFQTFKVETVALRFGNVYGPGSGHKTSVVAKFIRLALNRETLEIYGDGSQTRDFIYIDDLIQAVLQAATVPDIGGEIFQIATNAETSLNELVDVMKKVFKEKGLDYPEVKNSESRLGDVKRNYSDTSKAKKKLRWQTKFKLAEGLNKTLTWFLS